MAEKKGCASTTKAGKACKSPPIKGTDRCLAHSDAETRRSLQFIGGQPGSGRPRLPRPSEVGRRLIEENIAVIIRPHFKALGYDVIVDESGPHLVALPEGGAKVLGESKDGIVKGSDYEDLGGQMAAAEKLFDRFFGRPKQTTELSGPDGGPIPTEPVIPSDESFEERFRRGMEEAGLASANGAGRNGSG